MSEAGMGHPTTTSSRLRLKLQELAESEDWDGCIRLFEALEQEGPLSAHELVQKSACLQIGSEELGSLEGAEEALLAALDLARDYVPALLDLGWFYYAVQDDAETGLTYFQRAEEISRRTLAEALNGRNKCLEEIQAEQSS